MFIHGSSHFFIGTSSCTLLSNVSISCKDSFSQLGNKCVNEESKSFYKILGGSSDVTLYVASSMHHAPCTCNMHVCAGIIGVSFVGCVLLMIHYIRKRPEYYNQSIGSMP